MPRNSAFVNLAKNDATKFSQDPHTGVPIRGAMGFQESKTAIACSAQTFPSCNLHIGQGFESIVEQQIASHMRFR